MFGELDVVLVGNQITPLQQDLLDSFEVFGDGDVECRETTLVDHVHVHRGSDDLLYDVLVLELCRQM